MNSKEKIEFMLRKIREKAQINPPGVFRIDCVTVVDAGERGIPDGAPVLISQEDQISILRKMKDDGLLFTLDFDEDYRSAWITLMSLERGSDANPYEKIEERKDPQLIELLVVGGKLAINTDTGFVRLDKVERTLNPASKEFKFLMALVVAKNHRASYDELIGREGTKVNRRTFGYTVNGLKTALGILPKKRAKNKDIIRNIKKYGYGLLVRVEQR